jgi:hypothetical protein
MAASISASGGWSIVLFLSSSIISMGILLLLNKEGQHFCQQLSLGMTGSSTLCFLGTLKLST